MNKQKIFLLLATLFVIFTPVSIHAATTMTPSDGWRIHTAAPGSDSYRYGPFFIINADNSIDVWTSSPGNGSSQWDWIRHKKSTDGGQTWGAETIVLQPTPGSADTYSCCDPGVIKFGGYYYLGYTSTTDIRGTDNNVFVARSTSPTGPFVKWNGTGWGGDPQPFIHYTGAADRYGAGEPVFVINGNTLYIYATWIDRVDGAPIEQTRLWTASTADQNWPGSLTYVGPLSQQITDVKYVDAYNKFVAIAQTKPFCYDAHLRCLESTDGINFYTGNFMKGFTAAYLHNPGMSGNEIGHLDLTDNNFVAHAYGTNWGSWDTNMYPITLSNDNLPGIRQVTTVYPGNGQVKLSFNTAPNESYTIKYGTSSGSYTTTISNITGSPYTVTGLTNGTTYYFIVTATNTYGTSANSIQYSATPLVYSVSPRVGATASSQIAGWEASHAIDADVNSTWSSNSHTTANATEWIYVDTGNNRNIKRVTVTPRQKSELCFPSFTVQVSTDGTNWVDAELENTVVKDSYGGRVYEFLTPVYGRYVRLYCNNVSRDDNSDPHYYAQFGDIKIEEVPYGAAVSSNISGWESYKLIDRNSASSWSSIGHSSASSIEYADIDTGASQKVTGVRLKPRDAGFCFPVDFKFQYSTNGVNWTDVPGQSYTGYTNSGNTLKIFNFSSPVTARYIRLYATRLSADQFNDYYCQLADFYVDTDIRATASVSSSISGWSASSAVDYNKDTNWSSALHTTENGTEWIRIDLGSAQYANGLLVTPRQGYCFPVNFDIQYSNDGVTWTLVPGQSYNAYYGSSNSSTSLEFQFNTPLSARYFRIYATKLSPDNMGDYYFQVSEIHVKQ